MKTFEKFKMSLLFLKSIVAVAVFLALFALGGCDQAEQQAIEKTTQAMNDGSSDKEKSVDDDDDDGDEGDDGDDKSNEDSDEK